MESVRNGTEKQRVNWFECLVRTEDNRQAKKYGRQNYCIKGTEENQRGDEMIWWLTTQGN